MTHFDRRRQWLLALVGVPLLSAASVAAHAAGATLGAAPLSAGNKSPTPTPQALPGVPVGPRRPRVPRGPRSPRVPRGPRVPRPPRP